MALSLHSPATWALTKLLRLKALESSSIPFFPSSSHPGLFAKIGKLSLGFERRKQKLALNMVNLRFLRDMQRAAGHEGLVSKRQIGVVSEIWEPPAYAHHRET